MPKVANLENKYGRLKVVKELEPLTVFYGKNKLKRRIRIIQCECSCPDKNVIEARLENLNSGHTQSCGCFCKDQTSIAKTTHGLSDTPLNQCYNAELELDRENNNKHYTPVNCRFVTPIINANNKRNNLLFTIDGEKMTLAQVCKKYKVDYNSVYRKLKKGINILKAIKISKQVESV